MSFRNVLVTQHSKISYTMNHIVFQTEDDILQIPIDDIDVLLIGTTRAAITSFAIMELIQHQVKVIFTDTKSMPVGEINAYGTNTNRNRNIEKQIAWEQSVKDQLWQTIMQVKIGNQAKIIDLLIGDAQGADIAALVGEVEVGDPTIREAVAARIYFTKLFGIDFVRQNEDDPINILLNYGYSILLATTAKEIAALGYLTELGIHHNSYTNEYNLASDLMEPFRPLIDRKVYQMVDKNLTPANKMDLLGALNDTIGYNGQDTSISNAISSMVKNVVGFMAGERDQFNLEITL
ncbi:MAG: type II CRISPR-associated endonuclease Cas1 [Lactobacillaceae bacterium]|nr:type II CRISPR-associated endonuclease Cas1 [Lactobacillaceae bacterium]